MTVGADVNYRNDAGQSLLHCACLSLSPEVVAHCLNNLNCDWMINTADVYGCTPLVLLAKVAKVECANKHAVSIGRMLIQNGAHVAWKCKKQCTALHYAVVNAQRDLVTFMIKEGCAENSPEAGGTRTLLTALLLVKDGANLRLLIEAGVDVNTDRHTQEVMTSASGLDADLLHLLQQELHSPPPLSRASRTVIRRTLNAPNMCLGLKQLNDSFRGSLPVGILKCLELDGL